MRPTIATILLAAIVVITYFVFRQSHPVQVDRSSDRAIGLESRPNPIVPLEEMAPREVGSVQRTPFAAGSQSDIAIRVVDFTGSPVAGAAVIAFTRRTAEACGQDFKVIANSDIEGIARFPESDLMQECIHIVRAGGFLDAQLPAPVSGQLVSVVLQRGVSYEATCVDGLGMPVRDAEVLLTLKDAPSRRPPRGADRPIPGCAGTANIWSCLTNEHGNAVISGIPPGSYQIRVSHPELICVNEALAPASIPRDPDQFKFDVVYIAAAIVVDDVVVGKEIEPAATGEVGGTAAKLRCLDIAKEIHTRWPGALAHVFVPRHIEKGMLPLVAFRFSLRRSGSIATKIQAIPSVDFREPNLIETLDRPAVQLGEINVTFVDPVGRDVPFDMGTIVGVDGSVLGQRFNILPSKPTMVPPGSYTVRCRTGFPTSTFDQKSVVVAAGERIGIEIRLNHALRKARLVCRSSLQEAVAVAAVQLSSKRRKSVLYDISKPMWFEVGEEVQVVVMAEGLKDWTGSFLINAATSGEDIQILNVDMLKK